MVTKKYVFKILFIFILTITVKNVSYAKVNEETVSERNLAMFASIAYADLENINNYTVKMDSDVNKLTILDNKMVTDNELKTIKSKAQIGIVNLTGNKTLISKVEPENTYEYLFYNLASTDEVKDWKLVNYLKEETTCLKGTAEFTAMTFKKDNNIVIAYRGTDFDDIGDWTEDFLYGLIGYTGQESIAQNYAIKIAEQYPNSNIYVAGHSLGGYLAQIGGAKLVGSKYKENVKEICYFNGMGLFFWSNLENKLKSNKIINKNMYNELTNIRSKINVIQGEAEKNLKNWYANGGNLVCYYIKGDLISALGTHYGDFIGLTAEEKCIEHHKGNCNKKLTVLSIKNVLKLLEVAFNYDISQYVEIYKPNSLLNYIWITHETDNFFGLLDNTPFVTITLPENIKKDKIQTATVTINSRKNKLLNSKLVSSDFVVENKNKVSIKSISGPEISKDSMNNNIYTYKLQLKGGALIGNTTIYLKENSVTTDNKLGNKLTVSNSIKNKLK